MYMVGEITVKNTAFGSTGRPHALFHLAPFAAKNFNLSLSLQLKSNVIAWSEYEYGQHRTSDKKPCLVLWITNVESEV